MAKIVFDEGYSWNNLPGATVKHMVNVTQVMPELITLVREWQEVARSEEVSLVDVKGSVGLLLSDFCDILQLGQAERAALGIELLQPVGG